MEETSLKTAPNAETFGCVNCGADLTFNPGTTSLMCAYCGAKNEIPLLAHPIDELDYHEFLKKGEANEDKLEVHLIKCDDCGAESSLEPNITSSSCPYCASPLVVQNAASQTIIKPKSLLPFKLTKEEAVAAFKNWIKNLWFAPNALKKAVLNFEHFKGIYMPFWTFDSATSTQYTGQRGEYYYITENYTTTDSNGNSVTKSRQVQKTRWHAASGVVTHSFDDVLIPASESLPQTQVKELEPWDLDQLVPYDSKFLSGFITEKYQITLETGFSKAKDEMEAQITSFIYADIGGDTQRIHSRNTHFSDITFKHIILPAYISAYKFKEKLYRFMVNARTGEVQGERPFSIIKIALLVGSVILAGVLFYYFFKK